MAHVSFWQYGLHSVTAMVTLLPYNRSKFYCTNTKLNLILIYWHAHCIERFNKCSQQPVSNKAIYIYDENVVYIT